MVASRKLPFGFHPEAREEARHETRWYRDRDTRVSVRYTAELRHVIERACLLPESFPCYLHGTRKACVGRFPHLLVFMHRPGRIEIVAVAHTSRRPGYWRDRLDDAT